MTTYELLDHVADSINPLLALMAVGLCIQGLRMRTPRILAWAAATVVSIAGVYLIRFVDQKFALWSFWAGDYSSHTAFAVAVAGSIAFRGRIWMYCMFCILFFYGVLILIQQYHSVQDVVTSALLQAFVVVALHTIMHSLLSRSRCSPA